MLREHRLRDESGRDKQVCKGELLALGYGEEYPLEKWLDIAAVSFGHTIARHRS